MLLWILAMVNKQQGESDKNSHLLHKNFPCSYYFVIVNLTKWIMPEVSSNPFTASIINELFWNMTGTEGEGMFYFKGNSRRGRMSQIQCGNTDLRDRCIQRTVIHKQKLILNYFKRGSTLNLNGFSVKIFFLHLRYIRHFWLFYL